jgi:hypothetical protein
MLRRSLIGEFTGGIVTREPLPRQAALKQGLMSVMEPLSVMGPDYHRLGCA